MFRRLVLVVVLAAVGTGVVLGAATAASGAVPDASNHTAFGATFGSDSIEENGTTLHMTGVEPGTRIGITSAMLAPSQLAAMIDGEPTAAGARTTVPANGTIPVAAPSVCGQPRFRLTIQRLDTGETTTARYGDLAATFPHPEFTRNDYAGTPDGVVPVTIESDCAPVFLRLNDPDSDYEATIRVRDDEPNTTVWIDTSAPLNASELFTTEIDAEATDRQRTGYLPELNGTYRLRLDSQVYGNRSNTANLTVSPDARPRPKTDGHELSVESLADELNMDDRDERTFVRIDGVPSEVPVTAAFRDPPTGFTQDTLAGMLRSEYAGDDIRTRRYENGTVELSIDPAMRCLDADLTIGFQRLDTGATATARITMTALDDAGGGFLHGNYTVERGDVVPVTLTRECHDATLKLERADGANATASVTLPEDAPLDRNETVWIDTARAGEPSSLFRPEIGTPVRNATTTLPNGTLAPGTYQIHLAYYGWKLSTASLTVTNGSIEQSPTGPTPERPETSPPTPDAAPTTDSPSSDTPTTDRPATDAPQPNRTAAGNAHRPAGTDPFGTTATTDGTGPGFGPVLAALALAVLAVRGARRN